MSRVREKIPLLVMQPMNSNLLFRMETCIMSEEKRQKKRMRLRGIEPPHAAPEATALSTELQTHL